MANPNRGDFKFSGEFSVSLGANITTPLGELSLRGGVTTKVADGHTLLIVRHPENSSVADQFDIAESGGLFTRPELSRP
jgi:hypothetical protein